MTDRRCATLQQTLGDRYLRDRELGQGGMAIVYLAHDRKQHRPVAIKVLRDFTAPFWTRTDVIMMSEAMRAHPRHPEVLRAMGL